MTQASGQITYGLYRGSGRTPAMGRFRRCQYGRRDRVGTGTNPDRLRPRAGAEHAFARHLCGHRGDDDLLLRARGGERVAARKSPNTRLKRAILPRVAHRIGGPPLDTVIPRNGMDL
jgi:hypothetical protein